MNEDWKSLRPKAFFRWGIRMSLRLTPKAHRKNRLVMRMKGTRKRRSVTGGDGLWFTVAPAEVDIRPPLRERPVQVRVASVHEYMLPGDVAGSLRDEKENHVR